MSQEHIDNKSKYSALITAAIVILLCLVALTGATLALFTSNPDDGKIGIITTSGKVDIDIVDAEDTSDSLVGDVLRFEFDGAQEDILFEPGATFYTQGFKAKNIGNIPVNFRMYISNDENIDMKEFEKSFDFYITTNPTKNVPREKLISFTDRLEPGDVSETYYLVIKMKESVTNREFREHKYSGIGITVCAVQGNVEIKE